MYSTINIQMHDYCLHQKAHIQLFCGGNLRGLEFQRQGKFRMMNLATCLLSQSLPSVQLSQRH